MKGTEFEKIVIQAMDREEKAGRCTMCRYGVQAVHFQKGGSLQTQAIQSLPDFEGVLPPLARQFTFDAKVCSTSSFDMTAFRDTVKKNKVRQFRHLLKRARFGAIAFFLIHFPERKLKTKTDLEQTWAFPVHENHPLWQRFESGETTSITRVDCEEYATKVEWTTPPGCMKPRPDVLSAILRIADELETTKGYRGKEEA